jgi:hypothetical protein
MLSLGRDHVCAESLAATLRAICGPRLEWVLNECATNMNGRRPPFAAMIARVDATPAQRVKKFVSKM